MHVVSRESFHCKLTISGKEGLLNSICHSSHLSSRPLIFKRAWHFIYSVCACVQVVEDGYEFFAKRQLVTLFSAPNYCGEFDNAGAMMSVDETLMCSFQVREFLHF